MYPTNKAVNDIAGQSYPEGPKQLAPDSVGNLMALIADQSRELSNRIAGIRESVCGPVPSNAEKEAEPNCLLSHLHQVSLRLACALADTDKIQRSL